MSLNVSKNQTLNRLPPRDQIYNPEKAVIAVKSGKNGKKPAKFVLPKKNFQQGNKSNSISLIPNNLPK